ncbi:MAG: DNA repair protein RadA [Cellvibrionales bacterium]|nr:DNA repair protein RadA [Cellvibrionales bacterium]
MPKAKTAYVCTECGAEHPQWVGQCTACKAWNRLSEVRLGGGKRSPTATGRTGYAGTGGGRVQRLSEVKVADIARQPSGFAELDRVLGGGLVPGSSILIGGDPGAGKSTLLLQVVCALAAGAEALYVTGEESPQQVAMRAKRLGLTAERLQILAETSLEALLAQVANTPPAVLVVDSIQVMYREDISSAPGSVSQVRECAADLVRFAKQTQTVLFLVGHVTKEGNLAGPRVLEHMIDCSLMLDSSSDSRYRLLRSQKNRFGAVNELGVFAMLDSGLKEVSNPSAIFLSRAEEHSPGSLVTVIWEGTRPLLIELQALVDATHYHSPRRVVVGLDQNRLAMLLAALHRHVGIALADQDVFANVVGGVRVTDTSADVPLLLAALSSLRSRPVPQETVAFGEVGLTGEIRPVANGQERIRAAARHGFKRAIVPHANRPKKKIPGIEVIGIRSLAEAVEAI